MALKIFQRRRTSKPPTSPSKPPMMKKDTLTIEQIYRKYSGQWVALDSVTRKGIRPVSARVMKSYKTKTALMNWIRGLDNPSSVELTMLVTPPDDSTVLVRH